MVVVVCQFPKHMGKGVQVPTSVNFYLRGFCLSLLRTSDGSIYQAKNSLLVPCQHGLALNGVHVVMPGIQHQIVQSIMLSKHISFENSVDKRK